MGDRPDVAAIDRVRHAERALATTVDDPRFVPHLTLHETEAWVFAAADALADLLDDRSIGSDLRKIVDEAGGPELINDNPATAPSKRLRARFPAYQRLSTAPCASGSWDSRRCGGGALTLTRGSPSWRSVPDSPPPLRRPAGPAWYGVVVVVVVATRARHGRMTHWLPGCWSRS
jgi:hypothetical protein